MNIKTFFLCIAAAVSTFAASATLVGAVRFIKSSLTPKAVEAQVSAPPDLKIPTVITFREFTPPPEVLTPVVAESEEACEFSAGGSYYIIGEDYGKFEEFEGLEIVTRDYESDPDKPNGVEIAPKGSIYLSGERELKFKTIKIRKNKQISFVTKASKGVRYEFEGRFVESEEVRYKTSDGEIQTDSAVLKGRLSKWRDGVKIAEKTFKFGESCGC